MAYRFEQTNTGTDIVMDGWEVGISNSPYQTIVPTTQVANGVSDMRNIDIISVPGEASVALATTVMTANIALSNVVYTVDPTTDTFTWAGGTTLPNGTAIYFTNSGGSLPGGLSSANAYYIANTSATTFQITIPSYPVESLVIAGGGGGGGGQAFGGTHVSGGGGAGGYLATPSHTVKTKDYAIVVGTGGAGGTIGGSPGVVGVDSSFDTLIARGGGAGAGSAGAGGNGGSGGGGEVSGGTAIAGQGNIGGGGTPTAGAGGGGGSGGAGNGGIAGGGGTGGQGGTGTANSISGASVTYAGGGGGAGIGTSGAGGSGSGGAAGNGFGNGTNGTVNLGGGGGAGGLPTGASTGTTGGNGGSGIVIISYPTGAITATGGTITTSGGKTIHTFTSDGTFSVTAITGVVNITSTGTGTNTFSIINMAQPNFIQGVNVSNLATLYFSLDSNGRAWILDNQYLNNTGTWIYMSNLNDETVTDPGLGLQPWKKYLFTFGISSVNYIALTTAGIPNNIYYFTNRDNWIRNWKTAAPTSLSHYTLASNNRTANMFFCNNTSIGAIVETAGQTFDPTNNATYTYTNSIVPIAPDDSAICLTELGSDLLIGGIKNIVYPWDEISVQPNNLIRLPENYIYRLVTVNNTAYMFTGQRGRIYLTNGSNAQLFTKMPDHLSGTTNPYYTWGDATFNKNQLYFGVSATTNTGVAIPQYGGLWAIDLDTNALRLTNQLSYGTYAGSATALCSQIISPFATPILPTNDGYGLYIGWFTTIGGIDKGSSSPYTGGQAYVDSDIIPIGTFITKTTFNSIEYKLSTPLVTGENVAIYYRTNITENYTINPITEGGAIGELSGYGIISFEKVQWIQLRAYLTSTVTNPSFVRLKELRIRQA